MSVDVAADIYGNGKSRYMSGICEYIYGKSGNCAAESSGTYPCFVDLFKKFFLKISDPSDLGM